MATTFVVVSLRPALITCDISLTLDLYKISKGSLVFIDNSGYSQQYLYRLESNPKDNSKGMLGISVSQHESFKEEAIQKYGLITVKSVKWLKGLFFWISLLSIGIGFFNLIPIIPLDGGLMVKSFVIGTKFEKPVTFGISGIFLLILILLFFV